MNSRRSRLWLWIAIVLSAVAIGFGLLRLLVTAPFTTSTPFAAATLAPGTNSESVVVNLGRDTGSGVLETPTRVSTTPTLNVTLIGPTSPADAWANAILDRVAPLFDAELHPGDGFAWWQSQSAQARLGYANGLVLFDSTPLQTATFSRLIISMPNPENPDQLRPIGLVEADAGSLVLTSLSLSSSDTSQSWILTGTDVSTPPKALVIQAAARSLACLVAFDNAGNGQAELVLLNLEHLSNSNFVTPTTTATASLPTVSPSAHPTATRTPDIGLGRLIAGRLDTVIDGLASIPASDVEAYLAQHSSPGPLTWTENGPQLSGKPMGVNQATELKVEYLSPSSPTNSAITFFTATFEDDVTHLLEDHMGFQGQRMEEILYWMVYQSTKRQGTLIVSYDDYGARQAIGIVGFAAFPQSP